ncbi:MAG: hypothetical protein ACRCXL_16370 [Dermatophilaceae bacterium]
MPSSIALGELDAEPDPPGWASDVHGDVEDSGPRFVAWTHRPNPVWPMRVEQGLTVSADGRTVLHPVFVTGADVMPEIARADDWLALATVSSLVGTVLTMAERATASLLAGS